MCLILRWHVVLQVANPLQRLLCHLKRFHATYIIKQQRRFGIFHVIPTYIVQRGQLWQLDKSTWQATWPKGFEHWSIYSKPTTNDLNICSLNTHYSVCTPTKKLHNGQHGQVSNSNRAKLPNSAPMQRYQPIMWCNCTTILLYRLHVLHSPDLGLDTHR